MNEQPEIDVYIKGVLVTTVPKASEPDIRRLYNGKPEERVLVIQPHGFQSDPEKLEKIVQKLNPK